MISLVENWLSGLASKGAGHFHLLDYCGADLNHSDTSWKTFFFLNAAIILFTKCIFLSISFYWLQWLKIWVSEEWRYKGQWRRNSCWGVLIHQSLMVGSSWFIKSQCCVFQSGQCRRSSVWELGRIPCFCLSPYLKKTDCCSSRHDVARLRRRR